MQESSSAHIFSLPLLDASMFLIPNREQCRIDSNLGCLLRSRGHPFFMLEICLKQIPHMLRKAGNLAHGTQQI
jgi:hypothetical protein